MNSFQFNKLRKKYHTWSKTVQSFDYRLTPVEMRRESNVSDEDFAKFLKLPYYRSGDGVILVNEAMPNWQLMRDLLLALDRLPDSLLIDIYREDSKRYHDVDLDNVNGDTVDEAMRKIIFRLLPEIMWAHGNQIE